MNKYNIWKISTLRFVLFQLLLGVVLFIVILVSGINTKKDQANLIVASVRNSFLIGDNRSLTDSLHTLSNLNFVFVEVIKNKNINFFSLGQKSLLKDFFILKYSLKINSNLNNASSDVGEIVFYYTVFPQLKSAFYLWIIILITSCPYVVVEKKRIEKVYEKEIKNKESEIMKQVTEQVSHDIKSPVAVLRQIVNDFSSLPGEELIIVKRAVERIENIANDLLFENKTSVFNIQEELLSNTLNNIIQEKIYQFKERSNVIISFESYLKEVFVNINSNEFARVISNLINNSVEAIVSDGYVKIIVKEEDGYAVIDVEDSGKGIPEHLINRIGERKFSFNKNNDNSGSGLGFFHAKTSILKMGGTISIKSIVDKGTSVQIKLPIIPKLLNVKKMSLDYYQYVYIEDDELLRIVWSSNAKKKNISILAIESIDDFEANKHLIHKELTHIYIDHELGTNKEKGIDIAINLNREGYKNIFIATGHNKDKFSHLTWLNYSNKISPF